MKYSDQYFRIKVSAHSTDVYKHSENKISLYQLNQVKARSYIDYTLAEMSNEFNEASIDSDIRQQHHHHDIYERGTPTMISSRE